MVQGTLSLEEMHLIVEREHSRCLENQALGGFWKQPGDQESGARRLCLAHAGSHAGLTKQYPPSKPQSKVQGDTCEAAETWDALYRTGDLRVRALGRHPGICT